MTIIDVIENDDSQNSDEQSFVLMKGTPTPQKPKLIKKFSCNLCDKKYSTSSSLNFHLRTHTRKFTIQLRAPSID